MQIVTLGSLFLAWTGVGSHQCSWRCGSGLGQGWERLEVTVVCCMLAAARLMVGPAGGSQNMGNSCKKRRKEKERERLSNFAKIRTIETRGAITIITLFRALLSRVKHCYLAISDRPGEIAELENVRRSFTAPYRCNKTSESLGHIKALKLLQKYDILSALYHTHHLSHWTESFVNSEGHLKYVFLECTRQG